MISMIMIVMIIIIIMIIMIMIIIVIIMIIMIIIIIIIIIVIIIMTKTFLSLPTHMRVRGHLGLQRMRLQVGLGQGAPELLCRERGGGCARGARVSGSWLARMLAGQSTCGGMQL